MLGQLIRFFDCLRQVVFHRCDRGTNIRGAAERALAIFRSQPEVQIGLVLFDCDEWQGRIELMAKTAKPKVPKYKKQVIYLVDYSIKRKDMRGLLGHLLYIVAEESPLLVVLLEINALFKHLFRVRKMELSVKALKIPILMLQTPT